MKIFEFGLDESQPLLNAQTFAFEQLACIHGVTLDLRWAMIELAARSFTAICAKARQYLMRRSESNGQGLGQPRHC